jgi:LysR family carnitine catabolism transcriptional activator
MSVSLRQMRGFVEICRRGSFTAAAGRIGITQSGLSLLIQSLEQNLGSQLILRGGSGIELTEAGRTLLPIAERIIDDIDLAVSAVREPRVVSRITVAALPTLVTALVAASIADYRRTHGHVVMQVRDCLTGDLVNRVRNGDAHVGIGAFIDVPDDISIIPLAKDSIVAFGRNDIIGKDRKTLGWRELSELPLILMDRDSNIRGITDSVFNELRIYPRPAFEVMYVATAFSLAASGLGVAIVPKVEALHFAVKGTSVYEIGAPAMHRQISMIVRRNQIIGPDLASFIAHVQDRASLILG